MLFPIWKGQGGGNCRVGWGILFASPVSRVLMAGFLLILPRGVRSRTEMRHGLEPSYLMRFGAVGSGYLQLVLLRFRASSSGRVAPFLSRLSPTTTFP